MQVVFPAFLVIYECAAAIGSWQVCLIQDLTNSGSDERRPGALINRTK